MGGGESTVASKSLAGCNPVYILFFLKEKKVRKTKESKILTFLQIILLVNEININPRSFSLRKQGETAKGKRSICCSVLFSWPWLNCGRGYTNEGYSNIE